MQRLLISIIACFAAQLAGAQCLNATTAATPVARVASERPPGVELIKTAAAGTPDAPVLTQSVSTAAQKSQAGAGDERRRPAGAMLLAALALMSGIALRRAGASGE
ncbi:MAG TPA: hypothetical protein VKD22_13525 [Ramlibacter sp.]|nr:hypothetical protein [Ramlibacter sp.]